MLEMMKVYGADGCRGGWLVTSLDSGQIRISQEFDLNTIIAGLGPDDVFAIDIPIGLTDNGPRECDLLTRKALCPRGSCVFPAPIRPALNSPSRAAADHVSRAIQGKGVSAQAFGIYGLIASVERSLLNNPNTRDRVFEIHPEASFLAMAQRSLPPKRSREGRQIRRGLLVEAFGEEPLQNAESSIPRGIVEDLYDSLAALWSGYRIARSEHDSYPNPAEFDELGLRMAIHF